MLGTKPSRRFFFWPKLRKVIILVQHQFRRWALDKSCAQCGNNLNILYPLQKLVEEWPSYEFMGYFIDKWHIIGVPGNLVKETIILTGETFRVEMDFAVVAVRHSHYTNLDKVNGTKALWARLSGFGEYVGYHVVPKRIRIQHIEFCPSTRRVVSRIMQFTWLSRHYPRITQGGTTFDLLSI